MRNIVLELLKRNNKYKVEESKIIYSEIAEFDEVFVTNSIKGVISVKTIDKFYYNMFDFRNQIFEEIKNLV